MPTYIYDCLKGLKIVLDRVKIFSWVVATCIQDTDAFWNILYKVIFLYSMSLWTDVLNDNPCSSTGE